MEIVLIAAITENRAIDFDFSISEDRKRFRELTLNHPVIMGRKTYEVVRYLSGRMNIVISRDKGYDCPMAVVFNSLEEALNSCEKFRTVYVIGGSEIYEQAIDIADRLEITHILTHHDGKVFFPEINGSWKKEKVVDRGGYQFITYTK